MEQIGEGKTALVYRAQSLSNPDKFFAIKILKKKVKSVNHNIEYFINQEIEIHYSLNHKNIVKVHECGKKGRIKLPIGRPVDQLYFLVMDYV